MIDHTYLETVITALRIHHYIERLDPGLSDSEFDAIQRRFGFNFPPDLRAVLQCVLPVGQQFPNWRDESEEQLLFRLNTPLDGIRFDVEHNDIWPAEWGPRPADKNERSNTVQKLVDGAPRLIPIYAHRFIPAEPNGAGNPVFSVHQTDIIRYGDDLADYFHREFRVPLPDWAAREPKPVRFWDDALRWRD